jgi:hypothetical protein
MLAFILLVLTLPAMMVAQTPYIDCGNDLPAPRNVELSYSMFDVCREEPCIYLRTRLLTVNFQFIVRKFIQFVRLFITKFLKAAISFNLQQIQQIRFAQKLDFS